MEMKSNCNGTTKDKQSATVKVTPDKEKSMSEIHGMEFQSKVPVNATSLPDKLAQETGPASHRGDRAHKTGVEHPTTYGETLMHLFRGNVGAGMFALGDAYKNSGIAMAPWLIILLGIICIHCQHLLLNASDQMKKQLSLDEHPDFASTVELCFATGPRIFQKYAIFMRRLINLFLCVTQLGFCCVYFLFISKNIKQVCDYHGFELDVHLYMAIFLLPILLGCMIRNLKYLAPLSTVANILMVTGISITLFYTSQNLPPIASAKLVAHLQQFPLFFGTALYVFEGIGLVLPLKSEMKEPKHFDKPVGVLNIGMTFVTFLFIALGFLSYVKYGEGVQGSVTLNLPQDEILAQSVKVMIPLGIILTFPLQFYIPIEILFPTVNERFGPFRYPVFAELAFRTLFVLITFVLAEAVPLLELFISLIGALCSTTLALLFPVLLEFVTHWSVSQITPWMVVKNVGIFGLGILGCFTGTYESIRLIANTFTEGKR